MNENWNTANNSEDKPTNENLYQRQMSMLKIFLEHGAISREQYDISAGALSQKLGMVTSVIPNY